MNNMKGNKKYSIIYRQGSELLPAQSSPTSSIVGLLRICFPALQSDRLSDEEVLTDGIGFHDLIDTTWILFYRNDTEIEASASKITKNGKEMIRCSSLVGMITAIVYHNGLYLCNFCVAPEWRNQGMGLGILEESGYMANKHGLSTLIGNASTSDPFILKYYQSLGATVVDTGGGSSPQVASSVRLQRIIPQSTHGIKDFFDDLRQKRQSRRHRWRYGAAASLVAATVALYFWFREHKTTKSKPIQTSWPGKQ